MRTVKDGVKPAKRAPSRASAMKAVSTKKASIKSSIKASTKTSEAASKKVAPARARGTSQAKKKVAARPAKAFKSTAKSAGKRGKTRPVRLRAALLRTVDKQLNLQRDEIRDLFRLDQGVGQGVSHEGEDDVDRANFDASRDLALSLSTAEREALVLIQEAFGRLDQGSFGSCSHCSTTIAEERLLAIPWARHCVDCQELEERGLLNP